MPAEPDFLAARLPTEARRIVIACHDFNRGGTERVAITLARHWAAMGREVTFLVGSRGGGLVDSVDPAVDIIECTPPVPRSPTSRLRLAAAMAPHLVALRPDAVFLTGNFHFILAPGLKRALAGAGIAAPIIAKVSNPLLSGVPAALAPLLKPVVRRLTRAIDHLVFMAPELAAEGAELLPTLPASVIAEPNLPAGFAPLPRIGPERPPLLLAIGRMEPQKNLALAIRTLAALRESHPARLVILGEGGERAALEKLAAQLGVADAVSMPGFADPAPWLARASALLLTSRYEGYPAVVVEALAADVTVVATNCTPALAGLITSARHGAVVRDATPVALAEGVAQALTMDFTSRGERPATVAHHDAAASAWAYCTLFDRLAEGALHRPSASP